MDDLAAMEAMMAVSVYEYGYGAAAKAIRDAHHWSMGETFWLLSIWAFFQAGIAFPAGKLREKGILSARAAMLIGAVLSALGFASITQGNLVLAYLGFAVCGGIGAGLVYATCINLVGKWYPERRGGKTGLSTADSPMVQYRSSSSSATRCIPRPTSGSWIWWPCSCWWFARDVAGSSAIRRRTGGPQMSTP